MTLDLIILSVVLFAACVGAVLGAARQIAQGCGLVAAYFCCKPLGLLIGPKISHGLHLPGVLGVVAGCLLVFILVLVTVRFVVTRILRAVLVGRNAERAALDRFLGFFFGAAKAAFIVYVMLSGLTFVEDHVAVAGKKIGLSPKDSQLFGLAREYNLFQMTAFAPVKDLTAVVQSTRRPADLQRLKGDPAYKALLQDSRFREVMREPALRRPFAQSDYGSLLRNNTVLELVQDKTSAALLSAAALAGKG